ncbi:MAG: type II secretion system protein E [Verrucomicrobiales bacterium]|nr:type II secretion system protein E [Verrucomicrobiales bacterium]
MPVKDDYLVDTLADMGLVTEDDVQIARAEVESGEFEDQGIIDRLIAAQVVAPAHLTQAKAIQFGVETIDLDGVTLEDETVQQVPRHIVKQNNIIPVFFSEGVLTIAVSDPSDLDLMDRLNHQLKVDGIEYRVATQEQIDALVNQYYGGAEMEDGTNIGAMIQDITEGEIDLGFVKDETFGEGVEEVEADAPLIKLVNSIISDAFRGRASDIHIEPMEKVLRVRYRIDGCLEEVSSPPKKLQNAIISRLKIQSGMSIAERRIPQDGRIQLEVSGKPIDLRVNSLPTTQGESIVMRILDKSGLSLGLSELGFMADDQASFERMIGLPDGILLVTGPTGSGKTTTLYSCLNYINRPDKKIITVEDPVEYVLAGINQVQVNVAAGLTFAAALRAMLRQAPNVVMLGEIRDEETATIAINAALTGHLVFSTLHTNDAPSAVSRLIDIGIKPFLVASAARGIMAQRLVRAICKKCNEPYQPTDREMRALNITQDQINGGDSRKGVGCKDCTNGYRGRKGIFEVFVIDDNIRKLIFEKVSNTVLRARALEMGMNSLRDDGTRKVLAAVTTPEEVIEATVADEH